MKKIFISAATVALCILAGCDSAKSPDAVASDVASAQSKAASAVADAQQDAAKDNANAQAKVDDKTQTLDNTAAKGTYDVAIAKADGDQKVALEKCNILAGDSQKACKDQADAKHDLAVANAKARLAADNTST